MCTHPQLPLAHTGFCEAVLRGKLADSEGKGTAGRGQVGKAAGSAAGAQRVHGAELSVHDSAGRTCQTQDPFVAIAHHDPLAQD